MEDGSLLQEALGRENNLENALVVDVFCLPDRNNKALAFQLGSVKNLLALAETSVQVNTFIQSQDYPWLSGGDGPVFGVHVTDGIPHLRAICRYGVSVADEWTLIRWMLEFSGEHTDVAVECWDVDDGQVLLIQAAEVLPGWVDSIGPMNCRHRCWIQAGQVRLVAPDEAASTTLSDLDLHLSQALALIQENSSLLSAPTSVNQVIQQTCLRIQNAGQWHKSALAVPRSVAWLVENRPTIVAAACQAFLANLTKNPVPKHHESLSGTCEDWVWTTATMGRTHYSMMRTLSAPPHWTTDDAVPAPYQSIEVRRLKRQCAAQVTPHLRYGLQVGVRLVAGFDYLLQQQAVAKVPTSMPSTSLNERRILLHWSRIDSECQSTSQGEWLREAWQAGPNQAVYNMESVLKCPVFEEEIKACATPLSRPEESLPACIRKELLKTTHPERDFVAPRAEDVDDEVWMTMPTEAELIKAAAPVQPKPLTEASVPTVQEEKALDEVLEGFQSFMASQSGVEGISSQKTERSPVHINPTVFLNMLHAVLKAESAEELNFAPAEEAQDPFFSAEDYEMMEPEEGEADADLVGLMKAMDQELKNAATSRTMDRDNLPEGVTDEKVVEDAHVLSNLLQSLDSGAGGSGPVQNIMKEMGLEPPDLPSEEQE